MEQKRKLAVLGSTGSIGRQTLDIVAEYPQLFEVDLLVANRSANLLIEQALQFKPRNVVIASADLYDKVKVALEGTGIAVHTGDSVVSELVALPEVDTVVTAMVGYSGLASTIAAIKAGKKIALANKETLVVAGELINEFVAPHSHGLGRSFPHISAREACHCDQGRRSATSQLGDGCQNHYRQCHDDEQGLRDD